jgi:hypothetical protein
VLSTCGWWAEKERQLEQQHEAGIGKRAWDMVSQLALRELIKVALVALGVYCLGWIAKIWSANNLALLVTYKWPLLGVCTSSLLLCGMVLHSRYKNKPFRPTYPRIEADFVLLEKELTYDCSKVNCLLYKKRVKLKALRNGLDRYHDKYHWTGAVGLAVTSVIPEHEFRPTNRKNTWQLYEVIFQRTLNVGDTIVTELQWTGTNPESSVPFFSAAIEEPTEQLKFNLQVPLTFGIREVTCETSPQTGARRPFTSAIKEVSGDGKATWIINNPKLMFHYEVKWLWPGSKPDKATDTPVSIA